MPEDDPTQFQRTATEGAIAVDQQQIESQPVLVGPTTAGEFNTIGENLIPKGCFRFEDVRFNFDSSFVRPETRGDMPHLADLIEKHTLTLPGPPEEKIPPPLSIFGHTDPVGDDDYNKQLSGRRALAIYGMLTRDEKTWEDLFTQPFGEDKWGNKQIQTMLEAVGHSPGPIDGVIGSKTTDAVKAFQTEKGLSADGVVGPQTRKVLFRAYMDFLCGPRLELGKEKNFLARDKDGDGLKGDVQGCSEFNPVLVFSQEKDARFQAAADKTDRNEENKRNRRVMVLLFGPGRRVKPDKWPCPRVKEDAANCKKRFFQDGETRRTPQAQERKFEETRDTFACRFYQIISDSSPCEGVFLRDIGIRLYDHFDLPMPHAVFLARLSRKDLPIENPPDNRNSTGEFLTRGSADENGFIVLKQIIGPATLHLQWRDQPAPNDTSTDERLFLYRRDVFVAAQGQNQEEGARQRLHNIGYTSAGTLEADIKAFQRDYDMPVTGKVEDAAPRLADLHDSSTIKPFVPENSGPPIDNNP